MDLYAENILDHYRNPRNRDKGKAVRDKGNVVSHTEENISCGDKLTVHLVLEEDHIEKISWDGIGCAISQAAMSMLSEELEGMSADEVSELEAEYIYELLGVPVGPRRFKCALLCLHTLKNALRVAQNKESLSWLDTVELRDARA